VWLQAPIPQTINNVDLDIMEEHAATMLQSKSQKL